MTHDWGEALFAEIAAFLAEGRSDEERFTELAFALARLQYAHVPLYRGWCDARGARLDRLNAVDEIPALPTEAFKRTELHIAPDAIVRRFHTSGTTGGAGHKGVSCFSRADLALMDAAIDVNATRYLFPDHAQRRTAIFVLAPAPAMAPHMIMVYGMERLVRRYGIADSDFFLGPSGLETDRLERALDAACVAGTPVTLIGATLGFVRLFDDFHARGKRFPLPPASRVMDAGGFKGKREETRREAMLDSFRHFLDAPPERCVNLLGMTELASQFYDDNVAAHAESRPCREGKQNAPWTRTRAVDPQTLRVLPHGSIGILRHLDLANGGHPFAVQTDDIGFTTPEGFHALGRPDAVEARGCSVTVDELAQQRR